MTDQPPELNWDNASQHLQKVKQGYCDLLGQPGVMPFFGLIYIHQLEQRYNTGERTQDLYQAILDLE